MKTSIQRFGKIIGGLKSIRLAFPFLLLLFSFKPAEDIQLQKLPVVKKELKVDGSFKSIRIEGDVSLVLTNDPAGTIIIEGKEKEVKKISPFFENSVLVIDTDHRQLFAKFIIYLSALTLQTIQLNGDGNISSIDFLRSDHLHISLNGNIKVKVKTMGRLSFDAPDDIELLARQPVMKIIK